MNKPENIIKISREALLILLSLLLSLCLFYLFSCRQANINNTTLPIETAPDKIETGHSGSSQDDKYESETASSESTIVQEFPDETSYETASGQSQQLAEIKADFEVLRVNETDHIKIFQFIDNNITLADTEFADEMVDFIMEFSVSELVPFSYNYDNAAVQEKIWSEYNGTTDLNILKNSNDNIISGLAQDTLNRKYKLESSEGYVYPIVDYMEYKQFYGSYLSGQMNAFIDIMAEESENPSVKDAAIIIPLDEYVESIISLYEFEEKYGGFARIYYIVNMLNSRLWIYMGGIDNTPVFDFNGYIIQERLDDFKVNTEKYKGTAFGDKLDEYLQLLDLESYKRTEKVSEYIENITFY